MNKTLIIIPAYNEESNIRNVVNNIWDQVSKDNYDIITNDIEKKFVQIKDKSKDIADAIKTLP